MEWRRVPQVRCLNLGLVVDVSFRGVGYAGGTEALLRQRSFAFYYVQLLSAAAAVEDGARRGGFREIAGANARRARLSSPRVCGGVGARSAPYEPNSAGT